MSDLKLKNCPFCNCTMSVRSNRDWHRPEGDHEDHCPVDDTVLMYPATDIGLSALVNCWNTRVTQPEATAPAQEPEFICEITEGTVRINPYGDEPIISGKRTYTVNIPAAQDLSAAILALPCDKRVDDFQAPLDCNLYVLGFIAAKDAAAALASSANALSAGDRVDAVEGDLLPPVGSKVLIHLARQDEWVEHTVTGYYAWPDLSGRYDVHRVFVRVVDAAGYDNARLLQDVRLQSQKGGGHGAR